MTLSGLRLPHVESRTRLSETTQAIRNIVLEGLVPTGARLTDQELSAALGVSRATVREAVRQLVHEGLLVHEPYRGLRVADLDDQAVLDLAEIRAALETLAGQRLAKQADAEAFARLDAAVAAIEAASHTSAPGALNEAHIAFHRTLQELAGNALLGRVWEVIENQTRLVIRIDAETRPDADRMIADHRTLVDAVRSGDAVNVANTVSAHVLASARSTIELRAGRAAAAPGRKTRKAAGGRKGS